MPTTRVNPRDTRPYYPRHVPHTRHEGENLQIWYPPKAPPWTVLSCGRGLRASCGGMPWRRWSGVTHVLELSPDSAPHSATQHQPHETLLWHLATPHLIEHRAFCGWASVSGSDWWVPGVEITLAALVLWLQSVTAFSHGSRIFPPFLMVHCRGIHSTRDQRSLRSFIILLRSFQWTGSVGGQGSRLGYGYFTTGRCASDCKTTKFNLVWHILVHFNIGSRKKLCQFPHK